MAHSSYIPVIVGVADIKNASLDVTDAAEPVELMLQAIVAAMKDACPTTPGQQTLRSSIDSISVVANWTWPYPNTPQLIRDRLGCCATHLLESEHGGHSPAQLFDEAARRITLGQSHVAIVTGGEALASLAALKAASNFPPSTWTQLQDTTSILDQPRAEDIGIRHGLSQATQIYPLYEAGFRAHRNQSIADNNLESSQLYAEFARVAASNPNAWRYGKPADTAEVIGTVTRKNRIICTPYPLLMNAFNTVNMAAACILTSTEFARQIGIPDSRWIYPVGGAGTEDHEQVWKRRDYHSSRSLSSALDAALAASKLTTDQIDLFDIYSCFPIVPKLACEHLGLPITASSKPRTLIGGLTSFGGAGNNYSLHAITEMVRQLRAARGQNGLVLANGGFLTHHHAICLSRHPREDAMPYPTVNPLPAHLDNNHPRVEECARGQAIIETYTVQYGREGSPQVAFVIGRLQSNGHRFLANAVDEATLEELSSNSTEQIKKTGWVEFDTRLRRNTFVFKSSSNL